MSEIFITPQFPQKPLELEAMHRGPGPSKWRGSRKPGERLILEELEKGSGTFTELKKRCEIADSTLSDHLRTLEEKGEITREYKERKLLIKLADKATTPLERTLRHFETFVHSPQKLNVELGRELLTESLINEIMNLYIEQFRTAVLAAARSERERKTLETSIERLLSKSAEFNEITLVYVLASFECERNFPHLIEEVDQSHKLKDKERIKREMPRGFAILPILEKKKLVEKFDKLLEWFRPLLTSPVVKALFEREKNDHFMRIRIASGRKRGPKRRR